jgi:flagellar basal-body rod protein FlgF
MDNTFLIGLSQQSALRRHLDVIANNLANLSTPGFKSERPIFEEFIMPVAVDETLSGASGQISYVQDGALFRDFGPGALQVTDNPLDVAINGEGWFVVQTADGERYTRAGRFMLDADGQLVTPAGDPVMSDGGPIAFDPGETDIVIAADGTVSTSAGDKGRLAVVTFADERRLVAEEGRLFASDEPALAAENPRLAQGAIELSNVNSILEISEMIAVTRAYEATAALLSRADDLRRDAIDELGQVPA